MQHTLRSVTVLIILGIVFLTPPVAKAENSTSVKVNINSSVNNNSVQVRQELETRNGEIIKNINETKRNIVEDRTQTLQQRLRSTRAHIHGLRLEIRFRFYEQRLNNIATRIQQRIDIEKSENKNVTSAQEALNKGKTALATAVDTGKKAVAALKAITAEQWTQQAAEAKTAKDLADAARNSFIEARSHMMDAIKALANN